MHDYLLRTMATLIVWVEMKDPIATSMAHDQYSSSPPEQGQLP